MNELNKENKNLLKESEAEKGQGQVFYRFKRLTSVLVIASIVLNMMMPAFVYPFELKNNISDLKLFKNLDQKKIEEFIFKLLMASEVSAQPWSPEVIAQGEVAPGVYGMEGEVEGEGKVPVFDSIVKAAIGAVESLMEALDTKRRTEELSDQRLRNVAWVALKQSLHTLLNTFAYDTATWLASGAAGEKPMFYDMNWGEYMTGLVDSAAGDFIDRLSGDWLGFSVCNPSDFSLKLSLGLGIAETQRPTQPDCTISGMINNWESLASDPNFLDRFEVAFDPAENDLGIAITMFQKHNEAVEDNWWRGLLQRAGDKEAKGVISKISEKIFTPSFLVSEQGKELLKSAKDADYEKVKFGDIALDAVSTFINTLAGKLFKELFEKGLAAIYGSGDSDNSDSRFSLPNLPGFSFNFNEQNRDLYSGDTGFSFYSGQQAARKRFVSFLNAGITEGGVYDPLTKFSSCPDSENPAPDECVILTGFRQAIERNLTLSEAIKNGFIDGDKPFGQMDFSGESSLRSGMPYRSLVILRSYRIIPVTWEIAALAIAKFEKGKQRSLNELISLFNDKTSIYYGLIDPDWLLILPEHYCKAKGYGEKILYEDVTRGVDENADGDFNDDKDIPPIRMVGRSQYCADFESCLKETESGTCIWGYCTEERRIWNLDASECPKEFNTCQTFQSRQGDTFTVLQNTLDFNGCSISNVGCQWLCQHFNPISGVWDCTNDGERISKPCTQSVMGPDGVSGCPIEINCGMEAGQTSCVDLINDVEVEISEPCHSGSKWWVEGSSNCVVTGADATCTIPRGGVQCFTTGCEQLDNLLANPSFETPPQPRVPGVSPFNIASNWSIGEDDISFFTLAYGDSEQIYSGSNSLRFYNSGTKIHATSTSDIISLDTTKDYTFSGKVYSRMIAGVAKIKIIDASGNELASRSITDRKEEWQSVTFDFDGNTGSARVEIEVYGGTTPGAGQVAGTVWFDDFKISESCISSPIKLALIGTIAADQSKLHLDRDSAQCSSDYAGCSEFVRTKVGLGTNLVKNSSFEIWPDGQLFPPGLGQGDQWNTNNKIEKVFDAQTGSLSAKLTNGGGGASNSRDFQTDSIIGMKPNTTYRISLWAKSDEEVDSSWYTGILYNKSDGTTEHDHLIVNGGANLKLYPSWQRYIFDAYTTKVDAYDFKLSINNATDITDIPLYLDGIQIEEVATRNPVYTEYKDYGSSNLTYVKKAPDSLSCHGYTKERPSPYVVDGITTKEQCQGETLAWRQFCIGGSNNGKTCNNAADCPDGSCVPRSCEGLECCHEIDPLECFNYSPYCFADEVGCNSYTPLSSGPTIPAVVAYDDYCPAECIGYDSYKQSATYFETQEVLDFFIPKTAVSCSAAEAGCDEFTNLDQASQGGEAREYYKYLRMCKKPDESDANCKTFYAWQGSNEAGYQLKTYTLSTDLSGTNPNAPKDSLTSTASWPDEWCSDPTLDSNGNGLPDCCDGPEDIESNSFCRELYDITGATYYKIYQNTISCSDNCHPYRKTRLGENDADAQTNCTSSSGEWNSTDKACIYQAIPDQGLACSAEAAGCREYRGNAGGNIYTAYSANFESGTETGWKIGQIQSEALSVAGHSIRSQGKELKTVFGQLESVCSDIGFDACDEDDPFDVNCYDKVSNTCKAKDSVRSDICSVNVGEQYCGTLGRIIRPEKTYLISFWAKSASANIVEELEVKFVKGSGGTPDIVNSKKINIQPEWDYYLLGPYKPSNIIRTDGTVDPSLYINFVTTNTDSGEFYIDNLKIQEVKNYVYVNKGSWKTPESCDQNPWVGDTPIKAPQFMLGCKQYNDITSLTHNLKSFNHLCREIAVGCEAMIDTFNSSSPFEQKFNENDIDDSGTFHTTADDVDFSVTVPQDKLVYMVNRSSFQCAQSNKGCESLGSPVINTSDEVTGFGTIYQINNPDDYANSLCRHSEVGCEEFSNGNRFSYFKTPGDKTCEYRAIPNQTNSAWFKTNSTSLNPDCPIIQPPLGPVHPTDDWVGFCPAEYSSCTQFIDPATKFGKNSLFNYDFSLNIDRNEWPDGWYITESNGTNGLEDALWQKFRVNHGKLYILGVTSNGNKGNVDSATGYTIDSLLKNSDLKFEIRGCSALTSFDHSLAEKRYCVYNQRFCVNRTDDIQTTISCNSSGDCEGQGSCGANGCSCRPSEKYGEPIIESGSRKSCEIDTDCEAGNKCEKSLVIPAETYRDDNRTKDEIPGLRGEREYTGRFYSPWDQHCEIRVSGISGIDSLLQNIVGNIATAASGDVKQFSVRESLVEYALGDTVDKVTCSGLVDEKNGCVLFNDRSYVNYRIGEDDISYLTFDADVSGRLSQNELVNNGVAVTESDPSAFRLDSNVVLKVNPDRECEAWLYPNSFASFSEENKTEDRKYSTSVILCNSLDSSGECDSFILDSNRMGTCRESGESSDEFGVFCRSNNDCIAGQECVKERYDFYRDPEDIKNLSGYSKPGFYFQNGGVCTVGDRVGETCNADSQCNGILNSCDSYITGYYSFSEMKQEGSISFSPSTNFESGTFKPYGWTLGTPLRTIDVLGSFSKLNWKESYSKLIDNPVTAQQEGLDGAAPEGRGFVKISGPYVIQSEEIEVFNSQKYVVSAFINTLNLLEGKGIVRIEQRDRNGNTINLIDIMQLEAGRGWTNLVSEFMTDSDAARIVVMLSNWNPDRGLHKIVGSSYFDDIKVKPALNVAGKRFPNTYIPQTCRLYPEASSLSCDYYTDENYRLRGWLGYCLEPDPSNNKQCLLWWPVDLIEGGFAPEQPFVAPAPLYYCLNAVEDHYYLNSCLFQGGDLCAALQSKSTSADPLGRTFSWTVPEDWRMESWQIERFSASASILDCNNSELKCNDSNSFDRINFFKSLDEDDLWLSKEGLSARFDFNQSNNLSVINFEVKLDNCFCPNIDITFVVKRPWCKDVVQVVTPFGQNKAWWDRVSESGSGQYAVAGLGYLNYFDYNPFGSIVPPTPADSPNSWNLSDDLWIRPLLVSSPFRDLFEEPYQARAGTPYSCTQGSKAFRGQPCYYPSQNNEEGNKINWGSAGDAQDSLKRIFARSYGSWEFQGYGVCKNSGGETQLDDSNNPVVCACPESTCEKVQEIDFKACGGGTCSYYDSKGSIITGGSACTKDDKCEAKCDTSAKRCIGATSFYCDDDSDCPSGFCVPNDQSCEVGMLGCLNLATFLKKVIKMVVQTFLNSSGFSLEVVIVLAIIKMIGMILTSCGPKECTNEIVCGPGEGECLTFFHLLMYRFDISGEEPNALDFVFQQLITPVLTGASSMAELGDDGGDSAGFDITSLFSFITTGPAREVIYENGAFGQIFFGLDIFGDEINAITGSYCSRTADRCSEVAGPNNEGKRCCYFSSCNEFTTYQSYCKSGPNKGMACKPSKDSDNGDNCSSGFGCEIKTDNESYLERTTDGYSWKEPDEGYLCDPTSDGSNIRPSAYCEGGLNGGMPCFSRESCPGFSGICDDETNCITEGSERYRPSIDFDRARCSTNTLHVCEIDNTSLENDLMPFITASSGEFCSDENDQNDPCYCREECIDDDCIRKELKCEATGPQYPNETNEVVAVGRCEYNHAVTVDETTEDVGPACVLDYTRYFAESPACGEEDRGNLCIDSDFNPCIGGGAWDGTWCTVAEGATTESSQCNSDSDEGRICYTNTECFNSTPRLPTEDPIIISRFGAYYDYCAVAPRVTHIAVNGKTTQPTNISKADMVSLSFTVGIDPQQLPLTGYIIDWGDGDKTSVSGQSLLVRSDTENPFQAGHFYSYWSLLAANNAGELKCDKPPGECCETTPEELCVVIPSVQIRDNWGWCNGVLTCDVNDDGIGDAVGSSNWRYCYGNEYCGGSIKCRPTNQSGGKLLWGYYGQDCQNNPNAWQPFAGKIIVKP